MGSDATARVTHGASDVRRQLLVGAGALLFLTLVLFSPYLLSSDATVSAGLDLTNQFAPWRAFGFGELRRGNLPLWNPYVFAGVPFLAGMQSALLYPPNLLFVLLPLELAVDVSACLHTFLLGFGMLAWALRRGLRWPAALLGGIVLMSSAAYTLHVYSGHLPHLCAMAWAPLVLLAIDALCERPNLGWVLVGAAACALQALAGHPQYLFLTALAAGLSAALQLIRAPRRAPILIALASMAGIALTLAAAQLLPALEATRESTRAGALAFTSAASYSLPLENLATLLVPDLLGDEQRLPYWGRWLYWEASAYCGVFAVALALYGLVAGDARRRRYAGALALVFFLIALGDQLPLLRLLHAVVPGFDRFRAPARAMFIVSLQLSMLAAVGFDLMLERPPRRRVAAAVSGGLALALALIALLVWGSAAEPSGVWARLVTSVSATSPSPEVLRWRAEPSFVADTGVHAAQQILIASSLLAGLAALLLMRRRWTAAVWGIAAAAVLEASLFSVTHFGRCQLSSAPPPDLPAPSGSAPGELRIWNKALPNSGMSVGLADIWGYDSFRLRRYAELIAWTQRRTLDAEEHFFVSAAHPLFSMLRCRYALTPGERGYRVEPLAPPLPRLSLLSSFEVLAERERVFAALAAPAFDPRQRVILEQPPTPAPEPGPGPGGRAWVVEGSTDHLTIQAELERASILLITDAYARGWRALPLEPGPQTAYVVLPANHALRAIPLEKGRHRLRLEYAPRGFRFGVWISAAGGLGFIALLAVARRRDRARLSRPRGSAADTPG